MALTPEQLYEWRQVGVHNPEPSERDRKLAISGFGYVCQLQGLPIPDDEDVIEAMATVEPVLANLRGMVIDARTDQDWEAAAQYLKDRLGCSDQFTRDYIGVVRAREEEDDPRPAPVPRGP